MTRIELDVVSDTKDEAKPITGASQSHVRCSARLGSRTSVSAKVLPRPLGLWEQLLKLVVCVEPGEVANPRGSTGTNRAVVEGPDTCCS